MIELTLTIQHRIDIRVAILQFVPRSENRTTSRALAITLNPRLNPDRMSDARGSGWGCPLRVYHLSCKIFLIRAEHDIQGPTLTVSAGMSSKTANGAITAAVRGATLANR